MSWNASDYSISITTPYPFMRTVKVNFVEEKGKLHFIATGEWRKELDMIPLVYIDNESFIVEKADSKYVLGLFGKKYGQAQLDRYFKGTLVAFSLSPGVFNYKPETVIVNISNDSSENYEQAITENSTQQYMRETSKEILEKYYFSGAELMDLGAGVMYETREYITKSRITAVESSPVLQEHILEQFTLKQLQNLEIYPYLDNAAVSGRKFDIIFSTFGYLELNSLKQTLEYVVDMLSPRGVFIAGFWNSNGFLDNLFSMIQGHSEYVSGKRKGLVPVGQSRYSLTSFTHILSDFSQLDKLKMLEFQGICTIIPPYNYKLSKRLSRSVLFRTIDRFLGRIRYFAGYSDFIVVVLGKN